MRGAIVLSLALIPGLCEEKQDPSKGVPPAVWHLRQVMEKETTKDAKGEYVTPEQAERMKDAADEVAIFAKVQDADVVAETTYLLPRTWQWPQRQAIRDLLVVLGASKAGPVLAAENLQGKETEFRKQAMLTIIRLHREIVAMTPAKRVKRVLADAAGGTWNGEQFGWRSDLVYRYGAMALANDPAESVPELADLAAKDGPLRDWALTTLARIDDPLAAAALKSFYEAGDEPAADADRCRAAAFRFWSAFRKWPADQELLALVPGETLALHPLDGRASAVDQKTWDARRASGPTVGIRLGVEDESLGRAALVVDGDFASVVIVEENGKGVPHVVHVRLRRRGALWVVARWDR